MKKCLIILVVLFLLIGAGCHSQGQASGLTERAGYLPLENPYEAGEKVRFYASTINFSIINSAGRKACYDRDRIMDFSGEFEVDCEGFFGESPAMLSFAVPYDSEYTFETQNEMFELEAFCGDSITTLSGECIKKAKWSINTWAVETENTPIEFRFCFGKDKMFPEVFRYTLVVRLHSQNVVNASWDENRMRIGGNLENVSIQLIDTQEMKQTDMISCEIVGTTFDISTETINDNIIMIEDEAGRNEILLTWLEMGEAKMS